MADRVANPTQQENIGYFTLNQCISSNIVSYMKSSNSYRFFNDVPCS